MNNIYEYIEFNYSSSLNISELDLIKEKINNNKLLQIIFEYDLYEVLYLLDKKDIQNIKEYVSTNKLEYKVYNQGFQSELLFQYLFSNQYIFEDKTISEIKRLLSNSTFNTLFNETKIYDGLFQKELMKSTKTDKNIKNIDKN
jgi:hypothetical protein